MAWYSWVFAFSSCRRIPGAQGSKRCNCTMDTASLHEREKDKYVEVEQHRRRHDQLLRILIMGSMALIAFSLAFVLVYFWYTGRI